MLAASCERIGWILFADDSRRARAGSGNCRVDGAITGAHDFLELVSKRRPLVGQYADDLAVGIREALPAMFQFLTD